MSEVPPAHPSDDELRALSAGLLPSAELDGVSAHLAGCPACCRRIDEVAADDPLVAWLRASDTGRGEPLVGPHLRRSAVHALRHGRAAGRPTRDGDSRAAAALPVPRQVGEYDIHAEVGRGGMGVVYRAVHRGLRRAAAVKMVLAGEYASPAQELRFRLEAELAARVRHPNVVQVYEVGSFQGRPFLAMEWVGGGSLADRLDGTPWPADAAAALVETLARAVQAAHAEGVVHRDLKPANILLATGGGEVGTPKITDFGLAQPTDGGQTLTRSGVLVGTPGYMAPEQAAGRRAQVGPGTDVYALGVVLFQLLTGRLPFKADGTLEVLRAVAADDPPRPRRLRPGLPRDLEAVVLHCLEKEPARRYPTALALAEDLQRFRAGRPVAARPVAAAARLLRTCRRYPVATLLVLLLAASLLAGLGGVTWQWREAERRRDQADASARQAEADKQQALYEAYRARIAAASAALQSHDVADAARHLEAAPESLRGWEWRHLHSRLDDSSVSVPLAPDAYGYLLPGPAGLRIGAVVGDRLRLTDPDGGAAREVPLDPGRVKPVPAAAWSIVAAPTRRGLRVVEWVGPTTVHLRDEAGAVVWKVDLAVDFPRFAGPSLVAVSPDGTRLACVLRLDTPDAPQRVAVFDTSTGTRAAVCDGHRALIRAAAFSPDGTRLATAGEDRTARVWDAATGAAVATFQGHRSKVLGVAFRPDGARLVTTSSDGTARQWEAATGREVEAAYDRHSGEVLAASYSPDGELVVSAGTDRCIRVWRAAGRQDVTALHGHTGGVTQVAFTPDGRRLASLSGWSDIASAVDNTARVWDVDPRAPLPVLRGHARTVYPVAFSPDGRRIASGGWDAKVVVWDAATGRPHATLDHPGVVWGLAFAPDGSWLVSGCDTEGGLSIWDASTGLARGRIPLPPGSVPRGVAVSPDGRRMAATVMDVTRGRRPFLHVYELATGGRSYSAEGCALAYSPDGRRLATAAADEKTVLLLDAETHQTVARFGGHEQHIYKAAFGPDGRTLATCSGDRTVRLWDVEDGSCRVLRGHTDHVYAVAFHPDGTRLASGSRDGAVWLWDLARGEDVARLPGHTSLVWSLAFSPDGATLASGSGDTTVRLWDTAPLKARYRSVRPD